MKKYVYAFDIGGTTVKIGLFNMDGLLVDKWEIKTDTTDNGKHIVNDIYQAISNADVSLSEVYGYGFGVPGPVVDNIVLTCVNLGWVNYDVEKEFSEYTDNHRIYVENDANVAALGEAFKGAAQFYASSAMITVGTGIGGGLIVDHKVVSGVNGAAGEIGHMKINFDDTGYQCNCGKTGCLETVTSATAIHRLCRQYLEETDHPSSLRNVDKPSAKLIFDEAKMGDEIGLQVVETVSKYLGFACHVLSVTTNPSIIVIGGGVSKSGSFFIDKIQHYFEQFSFAPVFDTKIVAAELGNDAGIYGAASLALQHD